MRHIQCYIYNLQKSKCAHHKYFKIWHIFSYFLKYTFIFYKSSRASIKTFSFHNWSLEGDCWVHIGSKCVHSAPKFTEQVFSGELRAFCIAVDCNSQLQKWTKSALSEMCFGVLGRTGCICWWGCSPQRRKTMRWANIVLVFAKHLPPLSQCTEIRKYKYTKTELPVTLEIDIS